jgi:hypothetical protein
MKIYNPNTQQEEEMDPAVSLLEYIEAGYKPPVQMTEDGEQRVRLTMNGKQYGVPTAHLHKFLKAAPTARLTAPEDDVVAEEGLLGTGMLAKGVAAATTGVLGPAGSFAQDLLTGGAGQAAARALGIASGATLGFSDAAVAAAAPELMRAINEQHGGVKLQGELGTIIASVVASGGGTLGARAALGSLKGITGGAVKETAKRTLPKALSAVPTVGMTQLSERIGAKLVGALVGKAAGKKLLPAVLAQIGATGGTYAGLSAAEGAIWGLSQGLEEHFLGDPREMGEILAAHVGQGALFGAVVGGGIGSLTGLASGTVGRWAQQAARKAEEAAQVASGAKTSALQDTARSMAIEDFGAQMGLSQRQLHELQRKGEYMPTLFDETVLDDGAILMKEGKLVTPREAARRIVQADQKVGAEIGAHHVAMQEAAEASLPKAAILAKEAEIAAAAKAKARGAVKRLSRELQHMIDTSGWVSADDLGAAILTKMDELPKGPAADAARAELQKQFDFFTKRRWWDWLELKKEKDGLSSAFGPVLRTRKDRLAAEIDKASAQRDVWYALKEGVQGKVAEFHPSPEAWQRANDVYSSLVELSHITQDMLKKGNTLEEITRVFNHFSSIAGYRGGLVMTAAMSGAARKMVTGGMGAGMGAVGGAMLGGPVGAVLGAGVGVGAAAGMRAAARRLVPPLSITEFAWKAATNQHLVEATRKVTQSIDKAVFDFVKKSTLRAIISPMIGQHMVGKASGQKDSRKGAAKLRARTARLMYSPEAMGLFLAQEAGPLQAVHPQMGMAYAGALQRQVAMTHHILSAYQPAGALQPGLNMEFEGITDRELEGLGIKLGAVVDPTQTVKEIMAGVATDDQIAILKATHPEVFAFFLRALTRQVALHDKELTPKQRAVLARVGLAPYPGEPGLGARAQMGYQMAQAGMPMGGAQPGQNVMGSLEKVPDSYGTRETRRAREDAKV